MNGSKRMAVLLVGILSMWVGLGQFGPQVPLAGERQIPEPGDRVIREAKASPPAGSVDLRCQVEQPMTILSVVPPGQAVKKGDRLVELDASSLVDKRVQQVFQKRRTETEMVFAGMSRHKGEQAASGQIELAQKALRLAQGQLKAFTQGEYPHQLALAEGAARIAKEKHTMAEERVRQLQASWENQKDQAVPAALQEAQMALHESALQAVTAEGRLSILKSFVHDSKIGELELAVAQREFELACAKEALSDAKLRGEAALSFAEMSLGMESDRLARIEDQITKSKIYAPQDGTVVYQDDAGEAAIRPGAVVRERQILLRLVPATQPK